MSYRDKLNKILKSDNEENNNIKSPDDKIKDNENNNLVFTEIINENKSSKEETKTPNHKTDEERMQNRPKETIAHLKRFKELNTTTDSIFNISPYQVLIILKDGTNITDWKEIEDKKDILYISEDLSGESYISNKYRDLEGMRLIIAQGITSKVQFIESMFADCKSLIDVIGLETWDTSNLLSLENMFGGCSSLTSCDGLRYLDVSNVNDMTALFNDCYRLNDIDSLKEWNTSNLTKMWSMFAGCKSLKDLRPLSNWNTSNVTNMTSLFTECESLNDINGIRAWDSSNLKDMGSLLWGCKSLTDISALSNWNTSNVRKMGRMFWNCESLTDISPLKDWNVSNVEDMVYMFVNCKSLKDLTPLSNWKPSKVIIMRSMFDGCSSIESLNGLENWNPENVTTVERMFDGCKSLSDVSALKSWNLSNDVIAGGIFNECPNVKENPLKKEIKDKNKPLHHIDLNIKFLDIYGTGWCLVKLGDIYSRASYITDVPYDCLSSIVNAIKNDENFHVDFNGEGWTFDVEADNEQCYFNFHGGEKHAFDTMNKYDLAIVIYRNIRDNLSSWKGWTHRDLSPLLNELCSLIEETEADEN